MLRLYTTLFFWTIKKNEYVIFREFLTISFRVDKSKSAFRNSQVLEELMTSGETPATLTPQFSFERDFNRNDFVSLLFYLGLIKVVEKLEISTPSRLQSAICHSQQIRKTLACLSITDRSTSVYIFFLSPERAATYQPRATPWVKINQ